MITGDDIVAQVVVILAAGAIAAADALAVGVVTVAAQQGARCAVQVDPGQLLQAVVLEGMLNCADRLQGQVAVGVVLEAGQHVAAGGGYPPKSTTLTPTIFPRCSAGRQHCRRSAVSGHDCPVGGSGDG